MGMVYLLSTTIQAQIVQYSDDGIQSCIDCEEKSSSTERGCLCLGPFHLGMFNSQIANVNHQKEKWLYEQELLMAAAITGINYYAMYNSAAGVPANYNFSNIQRQYFKEAETNTLALEYFTKTDDVLKSVENYDNAILQSSTINAKLLDIRKREGTINPIYGDLNYKGKLLKNMSDTEANNALNEQLGIRNHQRSAITEYGIRNSRLQRMLNEGYISNTLAGYLVVHYASLGYEDAIRFFTRYMIWVSSKDPQIPYISFGTPENIFTLKQKENQYLQTLLYRTGGNTQPMDGYTAPVFNDVTDDVALFNYALNDQSSTFRSWVDNKDQVSAKLKKYYENNTYNQDALTESANLINANIKGEPFVTKDKNYTHFRGYPIDDPIQGLLDDVYQNQYHKNLLRIWHIQPTRVETSGMSGFFNLVETIERSGNLHANTKGSMIRQAFKVLDITPQWSSYTNSDLAVLFNLSSSSISVNDVHWADINYNFDIGRIMYDRGIKTADFIQSDLAFEAAMAITRNDTPTAEHYLRVYDLKKALQLNDAQEQWLIANRQQTDALNNFYNLNTNQQGTNFAVEALNTWISGGEVDFADRVLKDISFIGTKADCVYEKLLSRSGSFKKIINEFTSQNPVSLDLKFVVAPIPPNAQGNLPNATTSEPNNNGLITIVVNETNLANRTELGLARTLSHEVIHADIHRFFIDVLNSGINYNGLTTQRLQELISSNRFPDFFDAVERYGLNFYQHELMASRYVGVIADHIKAYDNSANSNNFYIDFSWRGLKLTEAWRKLDKNERDRITSVQEMYEITGNKNCN